MAFENIIGNDKIKNTLIDTINNKKVLNSYMFSGQEGIGKKKIAEEFAKMILCMSDDKIRCNECDSCIKFISKNHPDFFEIEPDGNVLKIAQIRDMEENIYQKPIISNKKVFIIDNAGSMSEEAQNCLLKTLEEPPEYIVIILITSNDNLLLNTIKSRCMKIHFNNLSKDEIISYINEKNLINNPTNNMIDMINGSIGRAELINDNLEVYDKIEELINGIVEHKYKTVVDVINSSEQLYKSKDNIKTILEYMNVIIYNYIKKDIDDSHKNEKYFNMIKIVEKAKTKIKLSCNYDMCIDELIFNIWEELNEKHSRY